MVQASIRDGYRREEAWPPAIRREARRLPAHRDVHLIDDVGAFLEESAARLEREDASPQLLRELLPLLAHRLLDLVRIREAVDIMVRLSGVLWRDSERRYAARWLRAALYYAPFDRKVRELVRQVEQLADVVGRPIMPDLVKSVLPVRVPWAVGRSAVLRKVHVMSHRLGVDSRILRAIQPEDVGFFRRLGCLEEAPLDLARTWADCSDGRWREMRYRLPSTPQDGPVTVDDVFTAVEFLYEKTEGLDEVSIPSRLLVFRQLLSVFRRLFSLESSDRALLALESFMEYQAAQEGRFPRRDFSLAPREDMDAITKHEVLDREEACTDAWGLTEERLKRTGSPDVLASVERLAQDPANCGVLNLPRILFGGSAENMRYPFETVEWQGGYAFRTGRVETLFRPVPQLEDLSFIAPCEVYEYDFERVVLSEPQFNGLFHIYLLEVAQTLGQMVGRFCDIPLAEMLLSFPEATAGVDQYSLAPEQVPPDAMPVEGLLGRIQDSGSLQ